MAQAMHEGINLLPIAGLSGELQQPFAKSRVQRAPLGAGDEPCLLDEVFIGTEGNVFHANKVYTKIVYLRCQKFPKVFGFEPRSGGLDVSPGRKLRERCFIDPGAA